MSRPFDVEPRTIAIVRARTGMGDLLCGAPALRALRRRLPAAHVALLTYPEMAPVVERLRPLVDELVAFPGWPGIPERPPDRAAIPGFLEAMRARRFDLAIQAYGANPAANEVTRMLGARRTAGFLVPGTGPEDLETHLPYPHHLHEIDRHLALMTLLGAPPAGRDLIFPVADADEDEAAVLRARAGLDHAPYVLIHPGATSPSRRWPAERYAAVGDALSARGLQVAVTGVASEASLVGRVVRRMRAPAAPLAGRTSLGGFAALLSGAAILVTADTGAAHVAAALGVPSVTVFLSGDPRRWRHPGPHHAVARVQVECNPCPHLTCPIDHRCAERLAPEQVVAEADRVLAVAPAAPRARLRALP